MLFGVGITVALFILVYSSFCSLLIFSWSDSFSEGFSISIIYVHVFRNLNEIKLLNTLSYTLSTKAPLLLVFSSSPLEPLVFLKLEIALDIFFWAWSSCSYFKYTFCLTSICLRVNLVSISINNTCNNNQTSK